MTLTWNLKTAVVDDFDSTYIDYRCWEAFAGGKHIATVKVWYGDHNSANSTRGSIAGAQALGMFKKHWSGQGYNWVPSNPHIPACKNDQEPRDWVDDQWKKWRTSTGI